MGWKWSCISCTSCSVFTRQVRVWAFFFFLSRNWIKRHALASRSSSQISQPVRLPSVLSQTVLEPSPRLFFSALTSYSTCMKSGELIHMGLLWCWMLCKIGAFRGTWTKEITKINLVIFYYINVCLCLVIPCIDFNLFSIYAFKSRRHACRCLLLGACFFPHAHNNAMISITESTALLGPLVTSSIYKMQESALQL